MKLIATENVKAIIQDKDGEVYAGLELPVGGIISRVVKQYTANIYGVENQRKLTILSGKVEVQ